MQRKYYGKNEKQLFDAILKRLADLCGYKLVNQAVEEKKGLVDVTNYPDNEEALLNKIEFVTEQVRQEENQVNQIKAGLIQGWQKKGKTEFNGLLFDNGNRINPARLMVVSKRTSHLQNLKNALQEKLKDVQSKKSKEVLSPEQQVRIEKIIKEEIPSFGTGIKVFLNDPDTEKERTADEPNPEVQVLSNKKQ